MEGKRKLAELEAAKIHSSRKFEDRLVTITGLTFCDTGESNFFV